MPLRRGLSGSDGGAFSASPRENPWAEPVRSLLLPHCGRCHQPGLPTSAPGALLAFDLTETAWHSRLTGEQLAGLKQRVGGTEAIGEADRALVDTFVRCEVDETCGAAE